MSDRAVANFKIASWDQTPYDESAEGPKLARATVKKTFEGDLEGESTAELLMCGGGEEGRGAGYIASERIVGKLAGRSGSFVIQHGGIVGDGEPRSFGNIVPDSGTGELAGIHGEGRYWHDANGATLTLEYRFVGQA